MYYDEINQADIIDLRNSSQKVEDYNRLIDREFNKLVAGTYRGSEGEWQVFTQNVIASTFTALNDVVNDSAVKLYIGNYGSTLDTTLKDSFMYGAKVAITVGATTGYGYISSINSGGVYIVVTFTTTTDLFSGNNSNTPYTITYAKPTTRTKSNTLTHTDIIGSPTNYPIAWKQSGVSGVPLIVAEDGTSLLPNGALTVFKHSKKVVIGSPVIYQVLKSTDSGVTWSLLVSGTHYTFNATGNTIAFVTAPLSTDLIMVTYQTHTNMAVAGVNSEVLAIGEFVLSSNNKSYAALIQSLLGKVTVDAASNSSVVQEIGYV